MYSSETRIRSLSLITFFLIKLILSGFIKTLKRIIILHEPPTSLHLEGSLALIWRKTTIYGHHSWSVWLFFCLGRITRRYYLAGGGGGVKGGRYSCLPCRFIKKEEANLFDSSPLEYEKLQWIWSLVSKRLSLVSFAKGR